MGIISWVAGLIKYTIIYFVLLIGFLVGWYEVAKMTGWDINPFTVIIFALGAYWGYNKVSNKEED